MNRPSVRYHRGAAEAEISTTSRQPTPTTFPGPALALAARRTAVGACTGRGTAGGGASITVRHDHRARLGLRSEHRSRHHLGHFVVGAVAPPRAGPLPGFGPQLTGELGVIGETLLDGDASASYLSQQDFGVGLPTVRVTGRRSGDQSINVGGNPASGRANRWRRHVAMYVGVRNLDGVSPVCGLRRSAAQRARRRRCTRPIVRPPPGNHQLWREIGNGSDQQSLGGGGAL